MASSETRRFRGNGTPTSRETSPMVFPGTPRSSQSPTIVPEDATVEAGYQFHTKRLGEGGFSTVRLATHLITREKVAIKCMDKKKLGNDLFRVKTEVKALKLLNHKNIAKLLQVIETENSIYLVLEYCSGGELFDYIVTKSRLTESESQGIMKSLLQCLEFLHSNGFSHRDLKPENILFDKDRVIKLIDFGLAADRSTNLSTSCGSPAYAAPELFTSHSYSGPAVDVWSAGVLLFVLLMGKLPFEANNSPALFKLIQAGKYSVHPRVSAEAGNVIRDMLQVDPKKRISVRELLLNPWIMAGKATETRDDRSFAKTLDEKVLSNTRQFFKNIPLETLKENILNGFGYQTATYRLLLEKHKKSTVLLQPPVIRRISRSADTGLDNIIEESDSVERSCKQGLFAQFTAASDNTPKLVGVKIKMVPSSRSTGSEYVGSNGGSTPKSCVFSPQTPRTPLSLGKGQITPLSKTPKANLFSIPSSRKGRRSISSPDVRSAGIAQQSPGSRAAGRTPTSILKRIMNSATPSNTPRSVNISHGKNITITKFEDPQECINKIILSLAAKEVNCKQKGFVINCIKKFKTVPEPLIFDLEICVSEGRCAILRKRLRGDSWYYKNVCEDVLRKTSPV